ncbi:hypothetical protein CU102_14770 [Phyllobacterium brassicacearum]|uniref:Uncharacterized protein n=1 Tax=Phyllobacterium brassicacearum TaxID=314235 RepID=A0A2P7BNZ3_9HYPH|nr:hypothetical protein CU102_14770 [Phyllobacterium brassicacearum]
MCERAVIGIAIKLVLDGCYGIACQASDGSRPASRSSDYTLLFRVDDIPISMVRNQRLIEERPSSYPLKLYRSDKIAMLAYQLPALTLLPDSLIFISSGMP